MTFKELLTEMMERKASDLHIRVGVRPILRVDGLLMQTDAPPMTVEQVDEITAQILNEEQKRRFAARNEMDLALGVAKLGRFRLNLFRQRGTPGIAVRAVLTQIPTMADLCLPDVIRKLCLSRRGLIVLTGATGSGKSTTLAAMLN